MFLFIMFLVCSSSIFDIVMINDEFMYKFAKRLALFSRELSGRIHVSVVPRCRLPINAPYWLGRVVVRGSDSFVESYIIPPVSRTGRIGITWEVMLCSGFLQ
jgi:predicted xylose isomerase-like sugar epimerase